MYVVFVFENILQYLYPVKYHNTLDAHQMDGDIKKFRTHIGINTTALSAK